MQIQNFNKVKDAIGTYSKRKKITYKDILYFQEKGYISKNARVDSTLFPLQMKIWLETELAVKERYSVEFESKVKIPLSMKKETVLNRQFIHYSTILASTPEHFGFEISIPIEVFDPKNLILTL